MKQAIEIVSIIFIAVTLAIFVMYTILSLSVAALGVMPPLKNTTSCQYPDRTTNPPNGCDNSDPCDAQDAAKGGSGECSDQTGVVTDQPRPKNTTSYNIDEGGK